jgi:radical SAM protein with 4Fe4S-binding SPASM domain
MECGGLPDAGYLPFRGRIYERAVKERIPLTGSMEITSRCNLHCVHCYISNTGETEQDLSLTEIESIVDQLVEEGCLWLLITGGEPLLRPDVQEFYTYVKRCGIIPILFTNGTLITDNIADLLASMPPYSVEVSIYGSTEGTFEAVTGIPGSFKLCMDGIERLLKRGIKLHLKTLAMSLNVHEVPSMKSLAEDLGIPFRFDTLLNCTLDGDDGPAKYRLSPERTVSLDEQDTDRKGEWSNLVKNFPGEAQASNRIFQCGAGVCTFHIDSAGLLSVCMMYREKNFDLRTGTFRDGWRLYLPDVLTREWSREVACSTCTLKSMCGQCPGWGYLEHGDAEEPVEYLCRVAHMRVEMLGLPGESTT